ncbi:NmrA family NAD(P)-binding protein [Fibrella arboris]|uniref:NmrA family NAD(P)-binding protein n=1 Tax=Fibrella arboris TaxID=3242486 RepID=UPI00352306F0
MNLVVTGSLGHISKPLANALTQNGHTVTVISSNPDKQAAIAALGATAAIGSLDDVDFLTATFTGADAVYAMVPPNFKVPDLRAYYGHIGRTYVQAIEQAGVKRVVSLSSYGADLAEGTGGILGAHDMEGLLNKLPNVAVTHLRPAYFYYNLFNQVSLIKGMGIMGANYGGDNKLIMVDPVDIAAVAADELTTATTDQSVRYIASDDRTCTEIAHVFGKAIGKPELAWVTFTDEQARSGMEANGVPASIAADLVDLGASIHAGLMRRDYDLHQSVPTGSVKLEDFAREFAAVYNG